MGVNNKYLGQAAEASTRLQINDSILELEDQRPVIFLGGYSGESITLAKAIKDVAKHVRVILAYYEDRSGKQGFIELEDDELILARPFITDYTHNQESGEKENGTGNAHEMQRLTGDKFLTNFILGKNGIPVPKQTRLLSQIEKKTRTEGGEVYPMNYYNRLVRNKFSKGHVVKTRKGCGGNGVILNRETDGENGQRLSGVANLLHHGCIIEELIESYPIELMAGKMDWNLRVLVTFDSKSEKYKTAGITGRIDRAGGPVNRSISAQNISFEDLAELCGWPKEEFEEIKGRVERTAELSCEVLIRAGNRKDKIPKYTNFQTLFGVDIIIDGDKNPFVLEVNDSGSGCMYELGELKGIEAIYSIAQAVIHKAQLIHALPDIMEAMEHISQSCGIEPFRLVELYNRGEIYIIEENGKIGFSIPEQYLPAGNSN